MNDVVIEELTKLLIKQDIEDKKNNSKKMVNISKVELIQFCIKLLKFINEKE